MLRDKRFPLLTTCQPLQAPIPACPMRTRFAGRHFLPVCAIGLTLLDARLPPQPIFLHIQRFHPDHAARTMCSGHYFLLACAAKPTLHDRLFPLVAISPAPTPPLPSYAMCI